ncbi:MAG: carboxypeptidase regulatory-like domain-containing protein [Gemmatimonadetes bacterium]|nr:carboxypeptidase regulatory-like domain-containing protein [Gemmatimonadota bacterium]
MSLPFRTVRALLNILPSPLVFPTLLAVAAPLVVSRALRAQAPAVPRPTPATGTPLRISGTLRSAESREVVRHARVVADRTVSVESNEEGVYFLTLAAGTHRLAVRAIGFARSTRRSTCVLRRRSTSPSNARRSRSPPSR